MKRVRTLSLAVIVQSLVAITTVQAAGPMGHYILARKVISNIASGGFTAPNELKQLLRDADCQRAYCGGAIGPDLVEAKSHYGATAELSMKMLNKARSDLKAAASSRDAKAFAAAKTELAFAYGWFSHFIVDMNVHEQVNGMQGVGDAYSYTSEAQKKTHGIYEGQLTAYLRRTIWNPNDKYDVLIPYSFVASSVGVSEPSVRQMSVVLKGKVAGELVLSGNCDLTTEKLASIWNQTVTKSLQEIALYLSSPEKMQNWDMDAGHISTAEFAKLRSMVIEINDGKLTPDWGKKYLVYWEAIRSLSESEQRAKIMELLGKTTSTPTKFRVLLTLNVPSNTPGRAEMPSGWQDGYISTWFTIELDKNGAFSFKHTVKGIGAMSTDLVGTGTLTSKGLFSLQCEVTGGRSYKDRYGNGPEFRCQQADKGSFKLTGTVTFRSSSKGKKYGLDFVQSDFSGSFESIMSITKQDEKGADLPTESHKCSGPYSTKSSGIEGFEISK